MPVQLKIPLEIVGGQIASVPEGSPADLRQRATVICLTPLGWLDGRPGLGLSNQVHREGGPDIVEIERQLATYIPQARSDVAADLAALNDGLARIGVKVTT